MYKDKILELKKELGDDLCIMGHHYQNDSVMAYVDKSGDSLELARMIENIQSKHIVFCGVYFMAEGSLLLAKEGQHVHLPNEEADCVMAQMVPEHILENVLTNLNNSKTHLVIPIAYVNTSLEVKSIVGKFGGAVCTSANAAKMLQWAIDKAKSEAKKVGKIGSVLFLPDASLAQNTANKIDFPKEDIMTLNVRNNGDDINASILKDRTELLLWPGCCAVHAKLKPKYIEEMRKEHKDCVIALHPECSPESVDMADFAGSTSALIKLANECEDNTTLIIGTEFNLVNRLAIRHKDRLNILPLKRVECSNMAKITEENLYFKLLEIKNNTVEPFSIDMNLKENALKSLQRMLDAC